MSVARLEVMNARNGITSWLCCGSLCLAVLLGAGCGGSDPLLGEGHLDAPRPFELADRPTYQLDKRYSHQTETPIGPAVSRDAYRPKEQRRAEPSNLVPAQSYATTRIRIALNLDAGAVEPTAPFDVTELKSTSNFGVTLRAFDEAGEAYRLHLFFAKLANAWNWYLFEDADSAGSFVELGRGELFFAPSGELFRELTGNDDGVALDFGDSISEGADGRAGSTSHRSPYWLRWVDADGRPAR